VREHNLIALVLEGRDPLRLAIDSSHLEQIVKLPIAQLHEQVCEE